MTGCSGRLGREVLRANLDDLARSRLRAPGQERSGTEAKWCYDRKPPCLYATVTQESSRWTARIAGGKCTSQQRLIAG